MSYKFFPRLTRLVMVDSLPDQLNFIKGGIENMLNKLAYRNFKKRVSNKGLTVSYSLDILTTERLDYNIFGSDFILVINPDENEMSAFPINITTYWGVGRYVQNFKISSFSYTPESFFDFAVKITKLTDKHVLFITAIAFCNEAENPFNELATIMCYSSKR